MKLALTNAPPQDADRIASNLVQEGLAACVNLLPVRSVYRWDGAIQHEQEVTLLIKVAARSLPALRQRLLELHPYELPELIVLDIDLGASHAAYVAWVQSSALPPG